MRIVALVIFILLSVPLPVLAAEMFEVGFFLNTENQDINAVEGTVSFAEPLLKLKEVRDGNSIINFWIERPSASNGKISFSGIIPGGYFGKKGLLFSLVFESRDEGRGAIAVETVRALLNDGQGTAAKTTTSSIQLSVSKAEPADVTMPEAFEPVIASDPTIFDGKYFLVFSTQDKGEGVDRYEIQENKKEGIQPEKWVIGRSPYVLTDQGLHGYIYVKAIDTSGNERIAMLPPQKPVLWYENFFIFGILILSVAVSILWKIVWKRRKK